MPLAVAGIVVGLAVLAFAADQFVIGAARVASRLRLSPIVIGAVVIGFGTSAPEMIVSALASAQGSFDIAVGNVIGSNIANLTLVLGTAAMVIPLTVASPTIRREAPLAFGATVAFALAVRAGLSTLIGIALLIGLIVALTMVIRGGRKGEEELTSEVAEFLDDNARHEPGAMRRETLRTIGGLIAVLGAAQVLVMAATSIAREIGLQEGFVGLTIVAVGTSLPELATSLQAARKGETELIIGNLLGSNLFNSLAVGGIAAIVGNGVIQAPALTGSALVLMLVITALATFFMATGHRVVRSEGALLLIIWLASLPLLA